MSNVRAETQYYDSANNLVHHLTLGNSFDCSFFRNGVIGGFVVGSSSVLGSEDISLQGHTIIKGIGTGTGTTLALYDNDSTPAKTWEWLDNGNVNIGQDSTVNLDTKIITFDAGTTSSSVNVGLVIDTRNIFSTASAAPSVFKILGLSGNPVFTVHSRGYPISKSDYTGVIAQFENRAGTQGLNLSSGTSQIASNGFRHIATNSDITDRIDQNVTNVYQQWVMVKNNVKNHWLRNGDTLAQASFFIDGFSGKGFNVGAGAPIGTENISLQGTVLINDTLDMNNNRILNAVVNPSVQEAANSATFTINADEQTDGVLTAMSASTTIAAPTGTPVQSQDLVFRFKDDGTARSLTWNAVFRAIGVTLPTTTVASKLTYVGCKYNSTDSKWDVIAVQQEA